MLRFARLLVSALAFGHIIIAPAVAGALIGLLLSIILPYDAGLVIGMVLTGLGLVFGFVWAIQMARRQHPPGYFSGVGSGASEAQMDPEPKIIRHSSGSARVDELLDRIARDEHTDGDYWSLLGNRLLLDLLRRMDEADRTFLLNSLALFSSSQLALLADALLPEQEDHYRELLPFRSELFTTILDHSDEELFGELKDELSFLSSARRVTTDRLLRIRERLGDGAMPSIVEEKLRERMAVDGWFPEYLLSSRNELQLPDPNTLAFELARLNFTYLEHEEADRQFRELTAGSNTDSLVIRCGAGSAAAFSAIIASLPFVDRRSGTAIVGYNRLLRNLLAHPSIFVTPSLLAELHDQADWALFDLLSFDRLHPLTFSAQLNIMVSRGGLYERNKWTTEEQTLRVTRFCELIMDGRPDDFILYACTEGWSRYFGRIGYDHIFLLFDSGKGEFWVLAKTDYD